VSGLGERKGLLSRIFKNGQITVSIKLSRAGDGVSNKEQQHAQVKTARGNTQLPADIEPSEGHGVPAEVSKEMRTETARENSAQPPAGGQPPEGDSGTQRHLAQRMRLEQAIAGVVGGPTGLLATLDMLVYDSRRKNPVGFQCHADGYLWRLDQLKAPLAQYEQLVEKDAAPPLYRQLLEEGERLRGMLAAPDELTDEALDTWREDMLAHIHLYREKQEGGHEE